MAVSFNEQVWRALKLIPRGRVTTYKEIARYLRKPKAARAVGNACGKNPDAPAAPCHRVVKSGGSLGGYSGGGGLKKKIYLLKKEGVEMKNGKVARLEKKFFNLK